MRLAAAKLHRSLRWHPNNGSGYLHYPQEQFGPHYAMARPLSFPNNCSYTLRELGRLSIRREEGLEPPRPGCYYNKLDGSQFAAQKATAGTSRRRGLK